MKNNFTRTWVEINTKAIQSNIKNLKKMLPKRTLFLAVIKSDAYGHGMIPVVKTAIKSGADYLEVFDFEEGILLRKAGIKSPILVLRSIGKKEITQAIKLDLDVCVSTSEILSYLKKAKLGKPLRVHIVVDTGLGRDGFRVNDVHKVVVLVRGNKNVNVVGLMTHFSGAESRDFDSYTAMQVESLKEWKRHFTEAKMHPMLHASATAGIFLSKEFALDMTRFGIGIYGLWPSEETYEIGKKKTKLAPALAWKTVVQEVKKLPMGSYIGYDLTHALPQDSIVAVLPIGYADGYPRSASGRGSVLIHGKRARILGRVMMNMIVVDVTEIKNAKCGDEVTLIGRDGKNEIGAEDLASAADTINYEIVTRIAASVPRIYR